MITKSQDGVVTIDALLKQEREHRKNNRWWVFSGSVINDSGRSQHVQIKTYGFYNQILKVGNDDINHASGHTINKVRDMQRYLREAINKNRPCGD